MPTHTHTQFVHVKKSSAFFPSITLPLNEQKKNSTYEELVLLFGLSLNSLVLPDRIEAMKKINIYVT